jgi:hypothetical protein
MSLRRRKERMLHRLSPRSAVVAATGLLLAACALVTEPDRLDGAAQDLAVNLRRWRDHGYVDYDYVVSNQCFCLLGGVPVRVVVRGNQVVSVFHEGTGQPVAASVAGAYGTVDFLFAVIDGAIKARAASIRAAYDLALGYPADVFVDYVTNAADEEAGFKVTSLAPVVR